MLPHELLAALVAAVLLPLVLHRIFFHAKPARHSSSAGGETLDDYITKVIRLRVVALQIPTARAVLRSLVFFSSSIRLLCAYSMG